MTATKRLVVDLPEDQVAMIEARVAAGEYESASALVSSVLLDTTIVPGVDEPSSDWTDFDAPSAETLRRLDAGLERTRPAAEVFAEVKAELEAMIRREDERSTAA